MRLSMLIIFKLNNLHQSYDLSKILKDISFFYKFQDIDYVESK